MSCGQKRVLGVLENNCQEQKCLRIVFYIYIHNFRIVGAIIKKN